MISIFLQNLKSMKKSDGHLRGDCPPRVPVPRGGRVNFCLNFEGGGEGEQLLYADAAACSAFYPVGKRDLHVPGTRGDESGRFWTTKTVVPFCRGDYPTPVLALGGKTVGPAPGFCRGWAVPRPLAVLIPTASTTNSSPGDFECHPMSAQGRTSLPPGPQMPHWGLSDARLD